MKLDLHMHSTISDGDYSPEELVEMVKEVGIEVMALTDHDDVDGVERAIRAAGSAIQVIPGVELSTSYKGATVHILGYGVDVHNQEFLDYMANYRKENAGRIPEMIRRCQEGGIAISLEDLKKQFPGTKTFNRKNLAEAIAAKGICGDYDTLIKQTLEKPSAYYVPKAKRTPQQAVNIIHQAGGKAVLAHPIQIRTKDEAGKSIIRDDYVAELLTLPFDGLEAYHYQQSQVEGAFDKYKKMAQEHGLFMTGGSDFHGPWKSLEEKEKKVHDKPNALGDYVLEVDGLSLGL